MNSPTSVKTIIVAAGKGTRFGADKPKQFCELGDRPMLMTTIERFADVVGLHNIVLVVDGSMHDFWLDLCRENSFESPQIVYGGATRLESVMSAISSLDGCSRDCLVMIHDGARPLVDKQLIHRMMNIPQGADGAVPGVPLTDSIRRVEGNASKTANRSDFVAVQTPQSFLLATLRQAYEAADLSDGSLTDDASVVERIGGKIAVVKGSVTNIKITNLLDMAFAEAILAAQRLDGC